MSSGRAVVVLATVLGLSACSVLATFDGRPSRSLDDDGGLEPQDEELPGPEGGAPTGPTIDTKDCPGERGAPPVSAGSFCVDSTEVTNTQYGQFLRAKGSDTKGQPNGCAFNATYFPDGWPQDPSRARAPVMGVDWCDAYAFCKWAGKRLCGKIGGGSLPVSDTQKASSSQWYAACTKNGANTFPYGDALDEGRCNDGTHTAGREVDVGSLTSCVGGPNDTVDMSGNVGEWEDSCDGDNCLIRGGSFKSRGEALACGALANAERSSRFADVGFRCCSP